MKLLELLKILQDYQEKKGNVEVQLEVFNTWDGNRMKGRAQQVEEVEIENSTRLLIFGWEGL